MEREFRYFPQAPFWKVLLTAAGSVGCLVQMLSYAPSLKKLVNRLFWFYDNFRVNTP